LNGNGETLREPERSMATDASIRTALEKLRREAQGGTMATDKLRDTLADWDALRHAQEVMRTDGVGFDVILTRRALVLERMVEAVRAVVAHDTNCSGQRRS
jgi:hypothetical protein